MRLTSSSSVAKPETLVSIGFYLFAGSLFMLALALYKNGDSAQQFVDWPVPRLWMAGTSRGFAAQNKE